jgi:hypothetical protein
VSRIHVHAAALAIAAVAFAVLGAGTARAGHVCQAVEAGAVEVDAMLDDWRGLGDRAPLRRGRGSDDSSFALRCAFDAERLYLAIEVRDDRLIRSAGRGARGQGGEDVLRLSLRAGAGPAAWTMSYFPGTRGFKARRVGGGPARADDSLRDDGWQLEVGVPLGQVPGWAGSTPLLRGEVVYADADRADAGEDRLRFAGELHFSTHVPALRGFLGHARLSVADLALDELAEIDGRPGNERVVAGGRYIAVLTDSFAFIELPIASPTDLERAELVDFDDDGRVSLLTHYRQRGGGGSREVVAVWTVAASGEIERALGFEVGLALGGRVLSNRWSLVPAGLHRADARRSTARRGRRAGAARRLDILVEVGPQDNAGWDAASFARITPSPDTRPILTPWSERRAVVYYFEGEVALDAPARPGPTR